MSCSQLCKLRDGVSFVMSLYGFSPALGPLRLEMRRMAFEVWVFSSHSLPHCDFCSFSMSLTCVEFRGF